MYETAAPAPGSVEYFARAVTSEFVLSRNTTENPAHSNSEDLCESPLGRVTTTAWNTTESHWSNRSGFRWSFAWPECAGRSGAIRAPAVTPRSRAIL